MHYINTSLFSNKNDIIKDENIRLPIFKFSPHKGEMTPLLTQGNSHYLTGNHA